ncbi:MAG: M48 family metalloprotease [Candidatus Angelobacter sp.]
MSGLHYLARIISLLVVIAVSPLIAQQTGTSDQNGPCAMPAFTKVVGDVNIFSEQQEEWLGQIMDIGVRQDFNIVEDPEGYLQKLGERLLAQLPATAMHYHFVIIDSPELNSFGVAGGRIYIHRRMIAFTQNEGELAALLGHEIGHAATHQVAIDMSRWLRELGVTQLGDRQDVFRKWNLFKDNAAKIKEHGGEKRFRDEQLIADRVGLYAMTRAGYDPGQFVEFADRSLQTKGKTGNFWSDFFGRTSFESRRLRELIHNSTPMPASCISSLAAESGHFTKWQQDVMASKRVTAQEELPGLIRKVPLQSPLRGDIYRIEFSSDGKYLLAQDESSVFVLTREPLDNVFRMDALDAHAAQFSPDSRSVVFYDKELRVEKWDIVTHQRASLRALTVPDCFQSRLSPSGEYMACVELSRDYDFGLQIIDVNTNKTVYNRKKFYTPYWSEAFSLYLSRLFGLPSTLLELRFSPDSRYFLAGHRGSVLAYDLKAGTDVHLPSRIQEMMGYTFAFVSAEEIAGVVGGGNYGKLVRAHFPNGEKIDEFKLPAYGHLFGTSQSKYLLMRPAATYPVGIVDLNAKKVAQAFRSSGFGIYGEIFAGEQVSGEIALFNATDQKRIARVQLPESPLASAKASSFSPDGKWLAVSGTSRGSVWQLETGNRIFFTHAFEGAYFDKSQLVAKFSSHEPDPPRMYELDAASKSAKKLYDMDPKANQTWQQGKILITVRPEKENDKGNLFFRGNSILEIRDVRTNGLLWDKKVGKSLPRFFCNENVLTLIVDDYDGIKAAARENPSLNNVLNAMDAKRDAYLVQAFEATTGKQLGAVLVDTGKLSFKVRWAVTIGDKVLVADSLDRTLVYSLKSGEQKGKVLGHVWAASPTGDRMLIGLDRGVAEIYDTSTLQSLTHFGFPSRISDAEFTADGSRLMILTADQTVYELKAGTGPENARASDSGK